MSFIKTVINFITSFIKKYLGSKFRIAIIWIITIMHCILLYMRYYYEGTDEDSYKLKNIDNNTLNDDNKYIVKLKQSKHIFMIEKLLWSIEILYFILYLFNLKFKEIELDKCIKTQIKNKNTDLINKQATIKNKSTFIKLATSNSSRRRSYDFSNTMPDLPNLHSELNQLLNEYNILNNDIKNIKVPSKMKPTYRIVYILYICLIGLNGFLLFNEQQYKVENEKQNDNKPIIKYYNSTIRIKTINIIKYTIIVCCILLLFVEYKDGNNQLIIHNTIINTIMPIKSSIPEVKKKYLINIITIFNVILVGISLFTLQIIHPYNIKKIDNPSNDENIKDYNYISGYDEDTGNSYLKWLLSETIITILVLICISIYNTIIIYEFNQIYDIKDTTDPCNIFQKNL